MNKWFISDVCIWFRALEVNVDLSISSSSLVVTFSRGMSPCDFTLGVTAAIIHIPWKVSLPLMVCML